MEKRTKKELFEMVDGLNELRKALISDAGPLLYRNWDKYNARLNEINAMYIDELAKMFKESDYE